MPRIVDASTVMASREKLRQLINEQASQRWSLLRSAWTALVSAVLPVKLMVVFAVPRG